MPGTLFCFSPSSVHPPFVYTVWLVWTQWDWEIHSKRRKALAILFHIFWMLQSNFLRFGGVESFFWNPSLNRNECQHHPFCDIHISLLLTLVASNNPCIRPAEQRSEQEDAIASKTHFWTQVLLWSFFSNLIVNLHFSTFSQSFTTLFLDFMSFLFLI